MEVLGDGVIADLQSELYGARKTLDRTEKLKLFRFNDSILNFPKIHKVKNDLMFTKNDYFTIYLKSCPKIVCNFLSR